MTTGSIVAHVLVGLVAVVTAAGGVLADLLVPATARQHFGNPRWPPHAKFHNGQTVWLGVLLGALALWLVRSSGGDVDLRFHLAVVVASLIWLSMLGAAALPGTRWVDPEFATGRRVPPQLRLALVVLALLVAAEVSALLGGPRPR